MSNLIKILPVLAELFRAGGRAGGRSGRQTDMAKLIVAFRIFGNAPKNGFAYHNIFLSPFASSVNTLYVVIMLRQFCAISGLFLL